MVPVRNWQYRKFKRLTDKQQVRVEEEVKSLLHASRDCLRNQSRPSEIRFDVNDGYYGEAFGIMHGLAILGFGAIDTPVNISHIEYENWNLRFWFEELCSDVLREEHFNGSNECDYCVEHFGKDGAGRVRQ